MVDIPVGAGLCACPQMVMQDNGPRATTRDCPNNYLKNYRKYKYTFVLLIQPVYNMVLSFMKITLCMPVFIQAYIFFLVFFGQ
jgi:hypothetical protein